MIRIYDCKSKTSLKAAFLMSVFLLFAAVTGFAQVVNLTAGPTTASMPDGTIVPMWGYTCGAAVTGSTATCAPLSGPTSAAATGSLGGIYVLNGGSGYSSSTTVTIGAPTGTGGVLATANPVIAGGVIVGFNVTNHGAGYTAAPTVTITDGAGSGASAAAAPAWSPVVITVPWATGGGKPDDQPDQQSLVRDGRRSEHSHIHCDYGAGGRRSWRGADHHGESGPLATFRGARPGSSPHNPQALRAQARTLQAWAWGPNRRSNNKGACNQWARKCCRVWLRTATAHSLVWGALKPGTYLLESGTHPSIQVPMGLIGMLVVTTAPASAGALAYSLPSGNIHHCGVSGGGSGGAVQRGSSPRVQ